MNDINSFFSLEKYIMDKVNFDSKQNLVNSELFHSEFLCWIE